MTDLVVLHQYKRDRQKPTILLIEEDFEYYQYVVESLQGKNVLLARAFNYDGAKHYLSVKPAPQVLMFDLQRMGDATREFVDWVKANPKLRRTYTVLSTSELYAPQLMQKLGLNDWTPRNMDQELLGDFLEGAGWLFFETTVQTIQGESI